MSYNKKCLICENNFISRLPRTITCSKQCRLKRLNSLNGRSVITTKIATATVGAISEMLIATDLFSKGYYVFRALSAACFCDLIAIKNNKILKIEVRTGYRNYGNGKMTFPRKAHNDIDLFAIIERNTREVVYFNKDFTQSDII